MAMRRRAAMTASHYIVVDCGLGGDDDRRILSMRMMNIISSYLSFCAMAAAAAAAVFVHATAANCEHRVTSFGSFQFHTIRYNSHV
jgi:hypothetical protein